MQQERDDLKQQEADAKAKEHTTFGEIYRCEIAKWLVGSTAWVRTIYLWPTSICVLLKLAAYRL